ncbi:DUF1758 domain-containing protein [Trichonephila clavipes]|nr:DUF1758 domain-containing protein [Trichonephila clavipes]
MSVVDKITDLTPVKNLNVKGLIPESINLANDSFYVPGPIDCLLGAEIFYELLRSGQTRSENSNLIFQNTGFREHPYAFTADVKMMYQMILIHESQQPLLRILWKESPEDPVKTFEIKTVTNGTVSAPFLATRTLLQLSRDELSFG